MLMKCSTISRILTLFAFVGINPMPFFISYRVMEQFHRTVQEFPRTINNIEAWHNSFQANISSTHPTYQRFLDVLLRKERVVRVRMLQSQAGHAPEPQRRRYAECNARNSKIVNDYSKRQVMDYLRRIAHNLSL